MLSAGGGGADSGALTQTALHPVDYLGFQQNMNEQGRQYAVMAVLAPVRYPVVVGVIAFGLLNPDPAYAPTFQTTPEDRPSVLEAAGETGLAIAVGAIGVKLGRVGSTAKREAAPRNGHLAGDAHSITGVPFDEHGFPDFRAAGVVEREVQITYTGTRGGDYRAANQAAGLVDAPKGMVWHHHQDGTTMQLVPEGVHQRTGHTGGYSLKK